MQVYDKVNHEDHSDAAAAASTEPPLKIAYRENDSFSGIW